MSAPAAGTRARRGRLGAAPAPAPQGPAAEPSPRRAAPRRRGDEGGAGGGEGRSPPMPPSEPQQEAPPPPPRVRKRKRPREVLAAPAETPERTKRLYDFLLSETMTSVLRPRAPTQEGGDDTQARAPRFGGAAPCCTSHAGHGRAGAPPGGRPRAA